MTTTPERTVVLAEDHADARDVIRMQLEMAGFEVHCTALAAEVTLMVQESQAHWLVLDLQLKDGWSTDVPRQVRALPWRVYIVVITGYNDSYPSHDMIDAGADDYIKKPVDVRDLLSRLRRAEEREHHVSAPDDRIELSTGDVFLSNAQFRPKSGPQQAFNSFEVRLLRRLWEDHPNPVPLEHLLLYLYAVSSPSGEAWKAAHSRFRKLVQSVRVILGYPEAICHDRKSGSYGLRLAPGTNSDQEDNADVTERSSE
jgi:DNA-binding response OmpR family regulator